ncbi:hypothetical protein K438DRAFT_1774644 [Mycena galopus ATCC 62051]|nr:hypothetical protein K438DRAFT_1774644 [Mycena galopus ATCC 62051]
MQSLQHSPCLNILSKANSESARRIHQGRAQARECRFGYNLEDEQTFNSCRQRAQLGATGGKRLIDELGASDFEVRRMSRPGDFENTTQLLGVIIKLAIPGLMGTRRGEEFQNSLQAVESK